MAAQGALGVAGRARGVEDRGRVVGEEFDVGELHVGGDVAEHVLERARPRRGLAAGDDQRHARRGQPERALTVRDQHLGAGVAHAVGQLGLRPPGVERYGDRPRRQHGRERDHPLRIVAHRHGHPVALAHAVLLDQAVGEGGGAAEVVLERDVLVLVHEEDLLAVEPAHLQQRPEVRRRVLPGAYAGVADLLHLEQLAGTGELSLDLGVRKGHTAELPQWTLIPDKFTVPTGRYVALDARFAPNQA